MIVDVRLTAKNDPKNSQKMAKNSRFLAKFSTFSAEIRTIVLAVL
jgi:hypothetical protein